MPEFPRDRAYLRRALFLWLILATALCIKTIRLGGEHSVFPVFAAGSQHWWADKSLYADYQPTEGIDGYRYSPTFAVVFTPFARMGNRWGGVFWGLTSIALLVWALHVLTRDVLPGRWPPRREGFFLTLTLAGSAVGIWSGQSNAVVPALVALAMAAIVRQRWWTAAWLLAVPVFIKLWPMAVVLLLIACWPRQLTLRFAIVSIVLAAVPFLTRPFDKVTWQYHEWYVSLAGPLQGRWLGYRDAWTVWEQLGPLIGCRPDWQQSVGRHIYMLLQLATAAAVLGWCLWQRRKGVSTKRLLTLIYSIWASWQLLLGPGPEQLTYGIIAPAASWAVLVSFEERRARWLTLSAWVILALLASGDVEQAVMKVFPVAPLLLPLGVALFVAWLLWHERDAVGSPPRA